MRRNQKGFTLMELMVVIVIVAILAAVAVPLYINYVKDARRTEAKAAIGALATALEEYYLNMNGYPDALSPNLEELYNPVDGRKPSNLAAETVSEIDQNWSIAYAPQSNQTGSGGYILTLTGDADAAGYDGLTVSYDYLRGRGGIMSDEPPGQ